MSAQPISVTRPVGQAFGRVDRILFHPFDAGKWFVLGFCAWLALLGRFGGRFNFNFNRGGGRTDVESMRHGLRHGLDFVHQNIVWILPLAALFIFILFALWVLFLWLSSRGQFMFLEGVVHNRAAVAEPWRRYRREANSLFRFRLVLLAASLVVIWPVLIYAGFWTVSAILGATWRPAEIWGLVNLGLLVVVPFLLFAIVHRLTRDFVVPIMYRRGGTCLAAWGAFLELLGAHFGSFVLYLLFQILLGLAAAVVILAAVVVTCCIAGCLLALPYLGTVALLPVLVFFRAYSIHYLAQYGPQYDVFPPPPPPVAAAVPGPAAP